MRPCSSAWPVKGVGEGSAGAGAGAAAASSRERRRASARSRASCAADGGASSPRNEDAGAARRRCFVSEECGGGIGVIVASPSSSYLWGARRRFSGDGVRRLIPGLFELNSLMALRFTRPNVDSWSLTKHARAT